MTKKKVSKKKASAVAKKKKAIAKKKPAARKKLAPVKKEKTELKQSTITASSEGTAMEKNKRKAGLPGERADALMGVWRKGGDKHKSTNSALKQGKLTSASGQKTRQVTQQRVSPVVAKPAVKVPGIGTKPDIIEAYLHGIKKHSENPKVERPKVEASKVDAPGFEPPKVEISSVQIPSFESKIAGMSDDALKATIASVAKTSEIIEPVTGVETMSNPDVQESVPVAEPPLYESKVIEDSMIDTVEIIAADNLEEEAAELEDPHFESALDEVEVTRQEDAVSRQFEAVKDDVAAAKAEAEIKANAALPIDQIKVEELGSGMIRAMGKGLGNGLNSVVRCGKYAVLGIKFGIKDGINAGKKAIKLISFGSKKEE